MPAIPQIAPLSIDPAAALVDWVTGLMAALAPDPLNGCPIAVTAAEAPHTGESLRRIAAAAFASWVDILAAAFQGEPEERVSAARLSLCCIEGALLLDRTEGGASNLEIVRRAIPGLTATARPRAEGI